MAPNVSLATQAGYDACDSITQREPPRAARHAKRKGICFMTCSSIDAASIAFEDAEVVNLMGKLSNAKSPSGFEEETLAAVKEFCEPFADFERNSLMCGFIKPKNFSGTKPVVMLDAHGDEVGLMVKSIHADGTLTFINLGGFSGGSTIGMEVLVRTTEGNWVRGVVGAKPPHFMTPAEREAGLAGMELKIDVGATSKQEAIEKFHMGVGEPVCPATTFHYQPEQRMMFGKAFDCRAGVAAMLLAMRELSKLDLPFDVVASVSAQEEVGERGVASAVRHFNPSVCFMFEGAPADDTFGNPDDAQCCVNQGPMFRYADRCMITHPRYQRFVLDAAKQAGLPAQGAVRVGGGTDGGIAHLMDNGIPCVVAGVPCRYIHSNCAIASIDDVMNTARVAVASVAALTPEVVAEF